MGRLCKEINVQDSMNVKSSMKGTKGHNLGVLHCLVFLLEREINVHLFFYFQGKKCLGLVIESK